MIWGYHHFRTPMDTSIYWPETVWKKQHEATDIIWFTQFHQALRGFNHNFSMDTRDGPSPGNSVANNMLLLLEFLVSFNFRKNTQRFQSASIKS